MRLLLVVLVMLLGVAFATPTCEALVEKIDQDFARVEAVDFFLKVRVIGVEVVSNHTELFRSGDALLGRNVSHRGLGGPDLVDLNTDLTPSGYFRCDSYRFLMVQDDRLILEIDTPYYTDIERWRFELFRVNDEFFLWRARADFNTMLLLFPLRGSLDARFEGWQF